MPRRDLVIATKAGSVPDPDRRFDGSRGHLLAALDASLERLGTDYVDVWQAARASTPPRRWRRRCRPWTWRSRTGRARYAGVSNFCGWQLAKAATWQLAAPGVRTRLASTQMEYSLLQRGIEREVLPAALDLGRGAAALLPARPRRADRQVPARHAGRTRGAPRSTWPRSSRRTSTTRPSRIVDAVATAADGLAATPAAGGPGLGPGPAGVVRPDRRRAQRAAAHGGVVSGGP